MIYRYMMEGVVAGSVQTKSGPFDQRTNVIPSGRLPSSLQSPTGSSLAVISAELKSRSMISLN